jgi:hypothetical protein
MQVFAEVMLIIVSLGSALAGVACVRNYRRPGRKAIEFFRESAVGRSIRARAGNGVSDPRIERAEAVLGIGFAVGLFLFSLVFMFVAVARLT